uniref:Uncharacterized protein n=1 Tax=Glossina palpalis gambiensis TaxID=67801 RepID=A0A1B0B3R4_9MUSC
MQILGKFSTTLQFTRRLSCNFSSGRYTSLVPTNQPQGHIKSEFSRPRLYSTKLENDNQKCVSLTNDRLEQSNPLSVDRLKVNKFLSVTIRDLAPLCCSGAMKMFLLPLSETEDDNVIENALASVFKSTRHHETFDNVNNVLQQLSEKCDNSLGRETETISKKTNLVKNTGLVLYKQSEINAMEPLKRDIKNTENNWRKDPIMSFQIEKLLDFAQVRLRNEIKNGITRGIQNALTRCVRFGDKSSCAQAFSVSSENFIRLYSTKACSTKLFNSHIVCIAETKAPFTQLPLQVCGGFTRKFQQKGSLKETPLFRHKYEVRLKSDKCKEDPCKEVQECPDTCKDKIKKVDHNKKLDKGIVKKRKPMGCSLGNTQKKDGGKPKKANSSNKIMVVLSSIPRSDVHVARISMKAIDLKIAGKSRRVFQESRFSSNSNMDDISSKVECTNSDSVVDATLVESKTDYTTPRSSINRYSGHWKGSNARDEGESQRSSSSGFRTENSGSFSSFNPPGGGDSSGKGHSLKSRAGGQSQINDVFENNDTCIGNSSSLWRASSARGEGRIQRSNSFPGRRQDGSSSSSFYACENDSSSKWQSASSKVGRRCRTNDACEKSDSCAINSSKQWRASSARGEGRSAFESLPLDSNSCENDPCASSSSSSDKRMGSSGSRSQGSSSSNCDPCASDNQNRRQSGSSRGEGRSLRDNLSARRANDFCERSDPCESSSSSGRSNSSSGHRSQGSRSSSSCDPCAFDNSDRQQSSGARFDGKSQRGTSAARMTSDSCENNDSYACSTFSGRSSSSPCYESQDTISSSSCDPCASNSSNRWQPSNSRGEGRSARSDSPSHLNSNSCENVDPCASSRSSSDKRMGSSGCRDQDNTSSSCDPCASDNQNRWQSSSFRGEGRSSRSSLSARRTSDSCESSDPCSSSRSSSGKRMGSSGYRSQGSSSSSCDPCAYDNSDRQQSSSARFEGRNSLSSSPSRHSDFCENSDPCASSDCGRSMNFSDYRSQNSSSLRSCDPCASGKSSGQQRSEGRNQRSSTFSGRRSNSCENIDPCTNGSQSSDRSRISSGYRNQGNRSSSCRDPCANDNSSEWQSTSARSEGRSQHNGYSSCESRDPCESSSSFSGRSSNSSGYSSQGNSSTSCCDPCASNNSTGWYSSARPEGGLPCNSSSSGVSSERYENTDRCASYNANRSHASRAMSDGNRFESNRVEGKSRSSSLGTSQCNTSSSGKNQRSSSSSSKGKRNSSSSGKSSSSCAGKNKKSSKAKAQSKSASSLCKKGGNKKGGEKKTDPCKEEDNKSDAKCNKDPCTDKSKDKKSKSTDLCKKTDKKDGQKDDKKSGKKTDPCSTNDRKTDKKDSKDAGKGDKKADPCNKDGQKDDKKSGKKTDPCSTNDKKTNKKDSKNDKKGDEKADPCSKDNKKGDKKADPCSKDDKKDDKKADPCSKNNKKGDKKEDPCSKDDKKGDKKADPCSKDEKKGDKKADSCGKNNKKSDKKTDPCSKDDKKGEKKADPCSKNDKKGDKKADPCSKNNKKGDKKADPCSKNDKKDDKKADPCSKNDKKDDKKADPCSKNDKDDKKADPCSKNDKKDDKKADPCSKNDKDDKKADPCSKNDKKDDKKADPCSKNGNKSDGKSDKKKSPCGVSQKDSKPKCYSTFPAAELAAAIKPILSFERLFASKGASKDKNAKEQGKGKCNLIKEVKPAKRKPDPNARPKDKTKDDCFKDDADSCKKDDGNKPGCRKFSTYSAISQHTLDSAFKGSFVTYRITRMFPVSDLGFTRRHKSDKGKRSSNAEKVISERNAFKCKLSKLVKPRFRRPDPKARPRNKLTVCYTDFETECPKKLCKDPTTTACKKFAKNRKGVGSKTKTDLNDDQVELYNSTICRNNEIVKIEKACEIKKVCAAIPKFSAYDVLVRTGEVAITGSDIHVYEHGSINSANISLGHDATGIIEATGECIHSLRRGDRVVMESSLSCGICEFCKRGVYNMCNNIVYNGFLMKYQVHPADLCYKLPDSVGMVEAALTQTLAQGCQAVFKAHITPTTNVLIMGSSAIAVASAFCAQAIGAKNVVFACTMATPLASIHDDFDFDCVCYDVHGDYGEILEGIFCTFQDWPDVVINCAINERTMNIAVMCLRPCGTCVLTECESEGVCFNALDVLMKNIRIIPSFRSKNMFATAIHLIKSGRAPMDKMIAARYQWSHIEQAFAAAQSESNYGYKKCHSFLHIP